MVKLYFKKLGFAALCLAVWFVFVFLMTLLFGSFLNFLPEGVKYTLLLLIPAFLTALWVYYRRLEQPELRRAYLQANTERTLRFLFELRYLFHFPPFQAELAATATLMLPVIFLIGFSIPDTPAILLLISSIIVFLVFFAGYLAVNFFHWLLVHKKWLTDAVTAKIEQ